MMKAKLVWVAVVIAVPALVLLLVACGHAVSDASTGQEQAGESPSWPTLVSQSSPRPGDPSFVVINTNDSDAGSLRQAIMDSNSNAPDAGTNSITFAIPGTDPNCNDAGVCTIAPASALPTITQPVTIDGYSQSGAAQATDAGAATLKIVLNGASAGSSSSGLLIAAGGSTVQGLVIQAFRGTAGIFIQSGSNTIAGNYLGTDVTGSTAVGNSFHGVDIQGANNTIGGTTPAARNVLSGNGRSGVQMTIIASGTTVVGNYIGTNASGTAAVANFEGIILGGPSNTIGGTTTGARNVISGNSDNGISVAGSGNGNLVEGNYIGTSADGTLSVRNGSEGMLVNGASSNTIGGTTSGAGNVISGNRLDGIRLFGASSNTVQGNFIGTEPDGVTALQNGFSGVFIDTGASSNTIGGTTAGAGNVISGNHQNGVYISNASSNVVEGNLIGAGSDGVTRVPNVLHGVLLDQTSSSNVIGTAGAGNVISGNDQNGINLNDASNNSIQANLIGVGADGTTPLGNGFNGVHFEASASSNLVGGSSTSVGNTIMNNTQDGVFVLSGTGDGILTNSIDVNGGLGIELGAGGNNNQASPVISSVRTKKGQTTVSWSLSSTASTTFTIQFFQSPTCDPSGSGEGRTFVGQTTGTTGRSGSVRLKTTLSGLTSGQVLTATATDPSNDTSQFSNCSPIP